MDLLVEPRGRRWTQLCLLLGLVLLPVLPARAQITGATNSTTGATCDGTFIPFGDCVNSVGFTSSTGAGFTSRYAWNINTDTDSYFMPSSIVATAQHNISFNVTVPGGYRLDVTSRRVGEFARRADQLFASAAADTSGVTGGSSNGLLMGTLNLPDPGGLGSGSDTVSVPFSQTSGAAIFGVSNGVAQSHTLTFMWDGSVHSNTLQIAIRQGENTTRTCPNCVYPGDPPRTQADDGHFVTVNLVSLCGNGGVDGMVGEQCDLGPSNGLSTSCCTSTCRFRAAGQVCRAPTGVCDAAEACTGSIPVCPPNVLQPTSTVCRASAGACDPAENCTGSSVSCPPNMLAGAGSTCRNAAGVCDVAETCSGSSATCPADVFVSSSTTCRASAGPCDVPEHCTGADASCPGDGFVSSATVCRAASGVCDVAESCNGGGAACPPDAFASAGTSCRAAAGVCDAGETCTGSGPACPADSLQPSTVECRASAGPCDVAEHCSGSDTSCPGDGFASSASVCRAVSGDCDIAESCSGADAACPPDAFAPSSVECRAAAGVCDAAETCTGSNSDCPPDAGGGAGVACRPAAGPCDVVETCTGTSTSCPADARQPAGTICRVSARECDIADACDGVASACPADALAPDGTPCDDGQACSFPDSCETGVCSGPSNIDSCVNHYLCYKSRASSFERILSVHLADELGDGVFDVVKPKHVCTPADKNGEGIVDGVTHLRSYQIRRAAGSPAYVPHPALEMANQIGTIVLDALSPDLLLVPAAKDLDATPPPPNPTAHDVDHYKCYKARVSSGTPQLPRGLQVQVADQFTSPGKALDVKKVRHLCVPVDKNGEGIRNPAGKLVCYQVRPASGQVKHQKRTVFVNDQLGPGTVGTIKEDELCIPSLMNP